MRYSFLLMALLGLFMSYGCKSNSPASPATSTVVIPNVGSTWTFQNIHRDSTNKIVRTDTSDRVVTQTNMPFQGFSDVVMTIETNRRTNIFDTIYLRYLSNGDISRYSSPAIDPQLSRWFTVPYASQGTQAVNFGGAINYLGFTYDTIAFSASYIGGENDTVGSNIYPAIVITSTTWQQASSQTKDSISTITQTNSFIPSKGIFGNHNVQTNIINGKNVQREQQTLIAVNLK